MKSLAMKAIGLCGMTAVMLAAPASAKEVTLVRNVLGPEGPLFVGGNLYFVAYVGSTLSKWDGKTVTVLNDRRDCDHNGLALTARKTLLLACDGDRGAVMELNLSGKELRRWDSDSTGKPFDGGMNDVVVAANGGAYVTLTTATHAPAGSVTGRVYYLPPCSKGWIQVASGLRAANGIGISPDQKTLYVAETGGNAIQKFAINSDGSLGNRAIFAQLDQLIANPPGTSRIGPDSFKVDAKGELYVAQLRCSRILKISPDGRLLHVFDIAAGVAPTNVAFGPGEKDLYVTVVTVAGDPKAEGSIVKIPNGD
jgi:gluconolactonase